ncbi:MAG: DNA repair protein RadC [Bacteroidota bacterium]
MEYQNRLAIKYWADEDRPREKLLLKGLWSLSNAELVAILIRSGNREESAVALAQRLLQSVDNDLNELGKRQVAELMQFHGIGRVKAISIAAALELGRRRQGSPVKERPQIRGSKDAYELMAPLLGDLGHEEFWILLLNRANRLIGRAQISRGGVAGTVVDAKVIFKKAVDALACSIILCHNHPSGNLKPSQADRDITRKLRWAGRNLEVAVLDHVIISDRGFYSFADEGEF